MHALSLTSVVLVRGERTEKNAALGMFLGGVFLAGQNLEALGEE